MDRASLTGFGISVAAPAGSIPLCSSVPNVIGNDLRCCNIVIGDRHISRRHAQVVFEKSGFVIYDLGSTNGTYVNGRCVRIHQLQDGDRVQLGDTTLIFVVRTWYDDGRQGDQDSR